MSQIRICQALFCRVLVVEKSERYGVSAGFSSLAGTPFNEITSNSFTPVKLVVDTFCYGYITFLVSQYL